MCESKFATKYELTIHIKRKHLNDRPKECDKCEYSSVTSAELTIHFKKKHKNVQRDKSKKCKEINCDKLFYSDRNAKRHYERVHMKLRNYSCELCMYSAFCKANLNDHKKIHKNILSL